MRRRVRQAEPALPVDNAAAVAALQRLIEARSQPEAPVHAPRPDANRWLNPTLMQYREQDSDSTAEIKQSTAAVTHRRRSAASAWWQALAAAMLLLGSGAFSYLAWSHAVETPATTAAESADTPPPRSQKPSSALLKPSSRHATLSARVRTLREENLGLRERLALLEQASI